MQSNKDRYDDALLTANYSNVGFYVVTLAEAPSIVCSTAVFPEMDFQGNALILLPDVSKPAPLVTFVLTATESGGAIIFTWLEYDAYIHQLISSFDDISNEELGDAATRFSFEFSENIYWSEAWWNSLPVSRQESLIQRYEYTKSPLNPRKRDALLDDGIHVSEWSILERVKSLPSKA